MDIYIMHSVFGQTIIIETKLVRKKFEVFKKKIIPPNLHDNMMIIRKDEINS